VHLPLLLARSFQWSVIAYIGMELPGTTYLETIIEDKNICCSAIQLIMADRCLQTGYSWHDDAGQGLFVYWHFDGHVGTGESCLVRQLNIWSNGRITSRV
jgi:hypothetical protein